MYFRNGLEQRSHILRVIVQIEYCMTHLCGCVQKRTVKLFVRCIEVHQKLEHFVDNFIRACFRAVDLVDADDNGQIQLECFFQHEFGLRLAPSNASTTRITPSTIFRTRSTSPPKSAWPGVSMMLIFVPL